MSGGRGPAKRALTRLHTSRVDYDNLVASSSSVGRRNRAHSKRRPDQPGRARKTRGGAVRVSPDPRGTDLGPPSSGAKGLVPETQRGTQGRGFLGPAVAPMRGVTPTPTSSRGSTVRDSALARRGGELDRQSVRSAGGEVLLCQPRARAAPLPRSHPARCCSAHRTRRCSLIHSRANFPHKRIGTSTPT